MKKIITLLFVGITILLNAQNPVHRILNNITGLPSNTVYNILQDKNGFIWIAHDKGLSRFDGKQIIEFKNNSEQSKSLSNLLEINDAIYCQDFNGNYYKTLQTKELEKIKFNTNGPYSSIGHIKNKLVSIKYDSLKTFDLATKKEISIALAISKNSGSFFEKNEAYFLRNNEILSTNNQSLKEILKFSTTSKSFNFLIKSQNSFFAITRNSFPYIHLLKQNNIQILPYLSKGILVQDVCLINNEIWVCTSTGAYCFDENFAPKHNGQPFFSNNSISKVIQDQEGNYWFSTLNNGILIVPNINSKFFSYNNESFTAISKNGSKILLGTNSNSIINFDYTTKKFEPLLKLPNNHEILNINVDSNNKVFVSSNQLSVIQNNSTMSYQIAAKSVTQINNNLFAFAYASDVGIINAKSSISIKEIPNWLITTNGLIDKNIYKLNIQKGRCRDVLYHSNTHTLYVATANGLFFYSAKSNGEIKFNNQSIYVTQLSGYNNTIYAGTFKQGIMSIDENKKAQSISITNNAIYKIHNYSNNIFLVSDDGLIQYNTLTNNKTIFTNADGLPKAEIKDILFHNNSLYLATSLGIVNLDIHTKKTNNVPPNICINDLLVNGEKVNWKNNSSLAPNKNNVTIHFSVLSFKSTDGVLVKYKINKESWQTVESNSSIINLPSLSAGNYNIQIKAINEDGIETNLPSTITFTIETPLYKRLWFISLITLMACFIVFTYFKKQLKNQKLQTQLLSQKIQLEKELQQSMMASIKSQMNPHFLFNSLNTIQSYIYTNEKENATTYLGKFSTLTRMILEMSNKSAVTIANEVKALNLYLELEKQRFEEKLNYNLNTDKEINVETSYIPSMLIQPYVENAIKHGLLHSKRQWELAIEFRKSSNGITVMIDDNGIGRKRSAELNMQKQNKHQGFSTNANKKRLDILNEGLNNVIAIEITDKEDSSGNALGTLVTFNIPFVSSN